MAHIKNYEQFVIDISTKGFDPYIKRLQELAGIRGAGADRKTTYLIEVSFDFGDILIEHKNIKNFRKPISAIITTQNKHIHVLKPITT